MRFAIHHAIALQDGGLADSLRQVALARAAGAEKQRIFPLGKERARGQVKDQAAIHLRIEGEVEVVQRLVHVAERGLFAPPSSSRSLRRVSSSVTRQEIRSIGAIA